MLKAFNACAASQGCCNNLSFGVGGKDPITGEVKKGWGYYETIAGGSGAGPTWDGASGVQCVIDHIISLTQLPHDQHENHRPRDP